MQSQVFTLEHPHSYPFIFSFKTEYFILLIHIPSIILTSPAFIILHPNNPHRDPLVILPYYFNTPTHPPTAASPRPHFSLSFLPRSIRRGAGAAGGGPRDDTSPLPCEASAAPPSPASSPPRRRRIRGVRRQRIRGGERRDGLLPRRLLLLRHAGPFPYSIRRPSIPCSRRR
jgi:hypothetical protein